jgi:hypothetical protein
MQIKKLACIYGFESKPSYKRMRMVACAFIYSKKKESWFHMLNSSNVVVASSDVVVASSSVDGSTATRGKKAGNVSASTFANAVREHATRTNSENWLEAVGASFLELSSLETNEQNGEMLSKLSKQWEQRFAETTTQGRVGAPKHSLTVECEKLISRVASHLNVSLDEKKFDACVKSLKKQAESMFESLAIDDIVCNSIAELPEKRRAHMERKAQEAVERAKK